MPKSRSATATDAERIQTGRYDVSEPDSLFLAVVETAAKFPGYDEYTFPAIEESIDLGSLEDLIRSADRNGTQARGFVEFEHEGLRIQIQLNGLIAVERL